MGLVEFHKVKDAQVWDKFRQGNTYAFEIVYERHIQLLANYGNRMCDDGDMVKDAIQDMFVDLWKNRENLGKTDSIKFYLIKSYRRNLVKKIIASKRSISNQDTLEGSNGLFEFSHEITVINTEIEKEKLNKLYELLDKLSNRQKEAIFLRFFGGLNYTEISETMEINQQSAYNLVFKALEILRQKMSYSLSALFILLQFIFG